MTGFGLAALGGCSLAVDTAGLIEGDGDTSGLSSDGAPPDSASRPAESDGGSDASSSDAHAEDASLAGRYRAAVMADGPALYFRFDDSSGPSIANEIASTSDGVALNGGLTFGAEGAFAGSRAIDFDHGVIALGDIFDFVDNSPFTVEFWYRPTEYFPKYCAIFGKDTVDGAGRQSYSLWANGDNVIAFERIVDGHTVRVQIPLLSLGTYYHVVATYDGAVQRLYINGTAITSIANTDKAPDTNAFFYVGGMDSSGCVKGSLDEFAMYEKALSPERILAHYRAAGR